MSGNRLLVASALLVALLGLTVWQWKSREAEYEQPAEVSVTLPKLEAGTIDHLEITSPGKPTIELEKVAESQAKDAPKKWRMTKPVAAEADQGALDTAVQKLTELEVTGVAATKAESHAQLEVDGAKATRVVAKQGGKLLVDLHIGAYRGSNTMVRQEGATIVAAVKGSVKFAFDKDVKDFRERGIVDVPMDKVQSAQFVNANGAFRFVLENGAWKQAPGEKAIANFDPEQARSIISAAANMSASDFGPADLTPEAAGVGSAPLATVQLTATTDKGPEEVVLNIGRKLDNGYYLTRKGKDAIFVVSQFVGDRLQPGADKLAKEPEAAPGGAPNGDKQVSIKKVPVKPAK